MHQQKFKNLILLHMEIWYPWQMTTSVFIIFSQFYSILFCFVAVFLVNLELQESLHTEAKSYITKQVKLLDSCSFEAACKLVRISKPGLKIWSPHFLLMYSFKRYLVSLNLHFFIYKIRITFFYMLIRIKIYIYIKHIAQADT